jgi:hypothetical protein
LAANADLCVTVPVEADQNVESGALLGVFEIMLG